ncbi:MAG: hypothetical protein LAT55_04165 [Opitutales bacterium]|nr:hypothetical protein [Opitutales bacterium]
MTSPQHWYLELNEFCVRAVRYEVDSNRAIVKSLREVSRQSEEFDRFLLEIARDLHRHRFYAHASAFCRERFFNLMQAEEAVKMEDEDQIRQALLGQYSLISPESFIFTTKASSGDPFEYGSGEENCLAAGITANTLQTELVFFQAKGIPIQEYILATTSQLGALQLALAQSGEEGAVLYYELGEAASHLFIVSQEGVHFARTLSTGIEDIVSEMSHHKEDRSPQEILADLLEGRNDYSDFIESAVAGLAQSFAAVLEEAHEAGCPIPEKALGLELPAGGKAIDQKLRETLGAGEIVFSMAELAEVFEVDLGSGNIPERVTSSWIGLLGRLGMLASNEQRSEFPWINCLYDEQLDVIPPSMEEEEKAEVKKAKPAAAALKIDRAKLKEKIAARRKSIAQRRAGYLPGGKPFHKTKTGIGVFVGGGLVLLLVAIAVLGDWGHSPFAPPAHEGDAVLLEEEEERDLTRAPQPERSFESLPPEGDRAGLEADEDGVLGWRTDFHNREGFSLGEIDGQNNWAARGETALRDHLSTDLSRVELISGSDTEGDAPFVEKYFKMDGEPVLWYEMKTQLVPGPLPDPAIFTDPSSVLLLANPEGYITGYDGYRGAWVVSETKVDPVDEAHRFRVLLNYNSQEWTLLFNGRIVPELSRLGFRDEGLEHLTRFRLWGSTEDGDAETVLEWIRISLPDMRGMTD